MRRLQKIAPMAGMLLILLSLVGCENTVSGGNSKDKTTQQEKMEEEESLPPESPSVVTPGPGAEVLPAAQAAAAPETQAEMTPTAAPVEQRTQADMESRRVESGIERWIATAPVEHQVAQLFMVPNSLGLNLSEYPVGGIIYFEEDLVSPEQTRQMLQAAVRESSAAVGIPVFTGVDEEGGIVNRISKNPAFGMSDPGNMADLGAAGDTELVRRTMENMGAQLYQLGFNVDFAPVADVSMDGSGADIKKRSFSSDANQAADMVRAAVEGLQSSGVCAAAKHFPGLGGTSTDTHDGTAVTGRTLEEMTVSEFLPFQAAIEAGSKFIMAGHISAVNLDESGMPASMSPTVLTQILRQQLGYEGIVITDAMNMGAIVDHYGSGEAAMQAIAAGADMILMPYDFYGARNTVLEAVQNGTISQERLHESLRRILRVKYSLN